MRRLAWIAPLLAAGLIPAAADATNPAPRVEILDSIESPAEGINGFGIEELSGLAWDADEELLYAVSDTGILHHFRLSLDGNRIVSIEAIYSVMLSASDDAELTATDAEDVAVVNGDNGKKGDSELLIPLEDGPAIGRFTPQGKRIAEIALPAALADKTRYAKKNRRLESVAIDARHGVLTAPETPLADQPGDQHTLYATDGTTWSFKAYQPKRSNLKAIEVMPHGDALVLERTRAKKGAPFTARLRYVDLVNCGGKVPCPVTEIVAESDTALQNNFEGMARLSDNLLLLVTDKTAKDDEKTSFTLVAIQPRSD